MGLVFEELVRQLIASQAIPLPFKRDGKVKPKSTWLR